ncbi:MAG TPA: hypothetical protein ENN28_00870 [Candidatus Uhrbacteria bacterium]|nr:hypothetical protein [Candidatus Uhrbacteria bacterium]
MRKFILLLIILGAVFSLSFYFNQGDNPDFDKLSLEQMWEQITNQRQLAIAKARQNGDYKCCIDPPCTMCFDSASQWNYGQTGKCFCDEFIARGEEPCPQCQKGIACASENKHRSADDAFCDINLQTN